MKHHPDKNAGTRRVASSASNPFGLRRTHPGPPCTSLDDLFTNMFRPPWLA
jgi:hypothetical protein